MSVGVFLRTFIDPELVEASKDEPGTTEVFMAWRGTEEFGAGVQCRSSVPEFRVVSDVRV
jgi:hypothetical protein